ncbi:hypothetical protein GOP47_0027386 [Adiantum capillus-veneris]|nr:hypothetical protein GOP47_0027386 [Adiantum capillus-veneris]
MNAANILRNSSFRTEETRRRTTHTTYIIVSGRSRTGGFYEMKRGEGQKGIMEGDEPEKPASHRPRTHRTRKPRLGRHLFLELDKPNGLRTSYEKNGPKTPAILSKGAFLLDIGMPRKKVLAYASSHGHNSQKCTPEGPENQQFKASHRKDRQRGLHDSQPECFQETRETLQGSSVRDGIGLPFSKQNAAGSKCHNTLNRSDLDSSTRQIHGEKVSCKPGLSSRTQNHKRRVVPRKFFDDDTHKDRCFGQKDNFDSSRGQNTMRNVCVQSNTDHVLKAELELPFYRKSNSKQFHNKVLKKGSSLKADEIVYQSDEYGNLMQDNQHNIYAQEIAPDRSNGQVYGEESSGEDAISGSNDQCSLDLEQSVHMNGNGGASNANNRGELQAPTLRKSSRIPKKRVFNDGDEAPLRRQKKKLQTEPAVELAEQEESRDDRDNEQLANECCEREPADMMGADHECHVRECLNSIHEPFQDEKKELPLTARQRALRIIKEGGDSEVDMNEGFPNSLQPVLPKRQKDNLTEAEHAIKKEEAARRRKQQIEKNAKEIQAVAIQKILGQESSRKKREEKLQKQRKDIEQEKQAAAMAPPVNSIRWVTGPSGNVVSFSQDLELPKIFSGPCSYPQEREKCAGPSCNNVYKYRDSKTRLPLCSLQCYRAVQELPSTGPAY